MVEFPSLRCKIEEFADGLQSQSEVNPVTAAGVILGNVHQLLRRLLTEHDRETAFFRQSDGTPTRVALVVTSVVNEFGEPCVQMLITDGNNGRYMANPIFDPVSALAVANDMRRLAIHQGAPDAP